MLFVLFCAIQFLAEDFQERTRETHRNHCEQLEGQFFAHFSTTSGLNRDSVLNKSRVFHVTEGVVMDAMHDVLEGSLQMETKLMLQEFICKSNPPLFSLADLNGRIRPFSYGYAEARNKPSEIGLAQLTNQATHTLGQSGLLRITGF